MPKSLPCGVKFSRSAPAFSSKFFCEETLSYCVEIPIPANQRALCIISHVKSESIQPRTSPVKFARSPCTDPQTAGAACRSRGTGMPCGRAFSARPSASSVISEVNLIGRAAKADEAHFAGCFFRKFPSPGQTCAVIFVGFRPDPSLAFVLTAMGVLVCLSVQA